MTTGLERDVQGGAYGALAAVMGAACMTVVRSGARRMGFIDRTVPQVMEEWLMAHGRLRAPGRENLHAVIHQVLHLGYGAAQGAVYGAAFGKRRRPSLRSGLALGLGSWVLGAWVIVPATGAGRGAWRRSPAENGVDLLAHLLFGVATEIVRDDLLTHTEPAPVPTERRRRARTG